MGLKNGNPEEAGGSAPPPPPSLVEDLQRGSSSSSSSRKAAVEEKQRLVLHELAVTLQTLECLTHVLDDLVVLTDASAPTSSALDGTTVAPTAAPPTTTPAIMARSGDYPPTTSDAPSSPSSVSIAVKQERLLEELHKWKDLL